MSNPSNSSSSSTAFIAMATASSSITSLPITSAAWPAACFRPLRTRDAVRWVERAEWNSHSALVLDPITVRVIEKAGSAPRALWP